MKMSRQEKWQMELNILECGGGPSWFDIKEDGKLGELRLKQARKRFKDRVKFLRRKVKEANKK